ncbi:MULTISPECIES: cytochrome b [Sphingomonas]|uniref:cytochrome b n=1 Tax=Sphingomonas TaxID=13687 RepID=UPI000DEFE639|nr:MULTISPECIES: cytochrome b [Sphingomonas]
MAETDAVPQNPIRRYSNVAVTIHWVTAALVLFQIWLGLSLDDLKGAAKASTFDWHKTIGILILLATLGRLTYRLKNPPPAFSPDVSHWERVAAVWNHRLFYLLLIGLPIGGYVAVSGHSPNGTTTLLGGITIPTIPGISRQMGELAGNMHGLLAWVLIALIAVHFLAALKHQFVDHAPAAGRMPPFRPPHGEGTVIGQGHGRTSVEAAEA